MKKRIALLLSAAMLVSITATAAYPDVKENDWFYEAVSTATEKNRFSGYEDGSFRPANNISRAEAAKVLITYKYGGGLPEPAEAQYSDVNDGEWYAPFVNISGAEDIIPASGGIFAPSEFITREDAVVGLVKVLGIELSDDDMNIVEQFTDKDEISSYALKYIAAARSKNIINGYDDGSFGPKLAVTRAEFAQILFNSEAITAPAATAEPTPEPTAAPSAEPTAVPTAEPTADPKATPTPTPSPVPITEEFKEKSIYIYGDAFLSQNNGWTQLLKDYLAPKDLTQKNSYSARFSTWTPNNFSSSVANYPEDADYIIIFGGRYEWEISSAIGDEDSVEETNFTGALRAFIDKVQLKRPNAKLVMTTVPNMTNAKDGFTESGAYNVIGMSVKDYSDRIRLVCGEKGVDLIDLNSECWQMNELSKYMEYKSMSYMIMNEDGNKRLAEIMANRLIEINGK